MDNQFSYDFNNYLKSCQPKPIKVYIMIAIGLIFLTVGEFSFFTNFNKMSIVGCSLPLQLDGSSLLVPTNGSTTLDNCFYEGFKLTTCINNEFQTGSNYSLTFSVDKFGLPQDHKNKVLLSISFLIYLSFQSVYQPMQYFQYLKRKRIQDILAGSQIFIDGKKRNERFLTLYFIVVGLLYIIIKIIWFVYRYNQFNEIQCDGSLYKLQFSYTISSSISTLLTSTIVYLIFPIIFIFNWINYLSELDFKKMTDHLSDESMKQIKNILVLDFKKYNKLIESVLLKRYQGNSKFDLFKRFHTFSFKTTPTSEIIEILLAYKLSYPQEFTQLLKNHEEKLSFITIDSSKNNNSYFRLN